MKRAPPPASFWHATLGSENLIILITIPSWEIHQLSWVGRGGHHLKYGREGANKGKSLCLPIKRKRMKSSNQSYKR